MKANYPRYIPNPSGPDKPEIKVNTEEEHGRVNPKDYAAFQAELEAVAAGPPVFDPSASIADERERCAVIAETYTNGGKIGSAIAKVIRGQVDEALRFPKVLHNPQTNPVAHGDFTVEGPDGTFTKPDVTVSDAKGEAAARAEGFTVIVSQNLLPGESKPEVPVAYRPKLLRNPATSLVRDDVYTVAQTNGQFTQPDKLVQSAADEKAARTAGFTVEIPAPKA